MKEQAPRNAFHHSVHALRVELHRWNLGSVGQLKHFDLLKDAGDETLLASDGSETLSEKLLLTHAIGFVSEKDYIGRNLVVLRVAAVMFVAGRNRDQVPT